MTKNSLTNRDSSLGIRSDEIKQHKEISSGCGIHTTETEKAILERIMWHDRYKDLHIVNSDKNYRK